MPYGKGISVMEADIDPGPHSNKTKRKEIDDNVTSSRPGVIPIGKKPADACFSNSRIEPEKQKIAVETCASKPKLPKAQAINPTATSVDVNISHDDIENPVIFSDSSHNVDNSTKTTYSDVVGGTAVKTNSFSNETMKVINELNLSEDEIRLNHIDDGAIEDLTKTSKLMSIRNELLEEMLKLREDDIATNRQKIAAIAHKRDDPSLTNQTQRNQYDCALNAVKMIFEEKSERYDVSDIVSNICNDIFFSEKLLNLLKNYSTNSVSESNMSPPSPMDQKASKDYEEQKKRMNLKVKQMEAFRLEAEKVKRDNDEKLRRIDLEIEQIKKTLSDQDSKHAELTRKIKAQNRHMEQQDRDIKAMEERLVKRIDDNDRAWRDEVDNYIDKKFDIALMNRLRQLGLSDAEAKNMSKEVDRQIADEKNKEKGKKPSKKE